MDTTMMWVFHCLLSFAEGVCWFYRAVGKCGVQLDEQFVEDI